MNFTYSKHSLEQIKRRNIPKSIVNTIINHPDKAISSEKCVKIFQKKIIENKKKYLYRVFVNICKAPFLIITVYKTSKSEKYEN